MARREKIWKIWFTVLVSVCFLVSAAEAKYSGGMGEPNDPYLISDVNDINEMRGEPNDWGGSFLMTADINLAGAGDKPDGSFSTAVIAPDTDNSSRYFQGTAFTGVFDGNDHKIMNLTIDTNGAGNDYLGLFGQIDPNGQIMNLGIEDANIIGGYHSVKLGGLCGENYDGTISNCYVIGSLAGGYNSYDIGGLCGRNYDGTISSCYATVNMTGLYHSSSLGGLCGKNGGTISNCYATGKVTVGDHSEYVGGLCGGNLGKIFGCYATGSVSGGNGSKDLGGFFGVALARLGGGKHALTANVNDVGTCSPGRLLTFGSPLTFDAVKWFDTRNVYRIAVDTALRHAIDLVIRWCHERVVVDTAIATEILDMAVGIDVVGPGI